MQKTLGGDRLGSGNKMKVDLHNYSRSSHNKGKIVRTTISAGTVVPIFVDICLPGDTWDFDLDAYLNTHPTLGPLFGSMKLQFDAFYAPFRLYQGLLHNNKLNIGRKMSDAKFPVMTFSVEPTLIPNQPGINFDTQNVNPSCILAYLGIRGFGTNNDPANVPINRNFNANAIIMYWDCIKNYYCNKQEEKGYVIHTPLSALITHVDTIEIDGNPLPQVPPDPPVGTPLQLTQFTTIHINLTAAGQPLNQIMFWDGNKYWKLSDLGIVTAQDAANIFIAYDWARYGTKSIQSWRYVDASQAGAGTITLSPYDIKNIDTLRERILVATLTPGAFNLTTSVTTGTPLTPYSYLFESLGHQRATTGTQEGLAVKTYQSDIFNNWLATEFIDGPDGINAQSAVDTSGGSFTIDALRLANKKNEILNRILVSGGSYDDWLDAVYTEDRYRLPYQPIYLGGLSKEIVFQEVISQAAAQDGSTQPLGTLAGKGTLSKKHKGGKVVCKSDEPGMIMIMASITPRLDYSQGNQWWTYALLTMDDIHKPGMDGIGFQDLITEQMTWWNTHWDDAEAAWIQKSAGKQPGWINYMTNYNEVFGNFAITENEGWMVIRRNYTPATNGLATDIDDLTTYIDPAKFNLIFAQTSLDSMNYWLQVGIDATARRKMSAKLMPNL